MPARASYISISHARGYSFPLASSDLPVSLSFQPFCFSSGLHLGGGPQGEALDPPLDPLGAPGAKPGGLHGFPEACFQLVPIPRPQAF